MTKALLSGIKVGTIPPDLFYEYRLQQIFEGYKWDYQSSNQPTISDRVILLDDANYQFLKHTSETLFGETVAQETEIRHSRTLLRKLGLSETLVELLYSARYDAARHVRLMRFDFHPTAQGWQISEVNSDVPAGFQEASLHPQFASSYFPDYQPTGHFGESLRQAFDPLVPADSTFGFLYDSHTVEDNQLMRFLGDYLGNFGYQQLHLEPNQLTWQGTTPQGIDAIVRHYPAEWLEFLPDVQLEALVNTQTPSANHPVAVIAQSKRLPLLWPELDASHQTWAKLLPKTTAPKPTSKRGWIFKPAFGRVGQGINIPGAVTAHEDTEIRRTAVANQNQWISQKLFTSHAIDGLHLAIGAFVVNGIFAGCFARASRTPLMNFTAMELPVLKS